MVAEIASLGAKTEVQAGIKQAKHTLESIPGRNLLLAIATPRQSYCQNGPSINKKRNLELRHRKQTDHRELSIPFLLEKSRTPISQTALKDLPLPEHPIHS
jgi:hypothetical protein